MADLIYRTHAVERMTSRKISAQTVELIFSDPDGVIKQSFDKQIFFKRVRGRKDNMIVIVVLAEVEILTVMNFFEVKS